MNTVTDTAMAHSLPLSGSPNTIPDVRAATAAVREALDVLQRASSECWRNGDVRTPGPVHISAALPAVSAALSRALRALEHGGSHL